MGSWLFAATLQALLLSASCISNNQRRSTGLTQGGLPPSKSGWRPVVGAGGVLYGPFGTAPLHAPPGYKIPIPVVDVYQTSSRPLPTKDATKLTSIAQSYRPTTLRTVSAASAVPVINQPINTYHNPFNVQNNGFQNYKFIQNFPAQSVLVRNPHNPYIERPVFSKYPNKLKHNHYLQNAMLQQLTNIQPIQFGQYQPNPTLDNYVRQNEVKKPQATTIETFKPEVFKLDNDAAPQSVNQQVRTVQQFGNPYQQYSFQDSLVPPTILGSFGTFGIQSLKGRDPVYQFQSTFAPIQSTKQTVFNSFSYIPQYKTTPKILDPTTPRGPTAANQIHFGSTHSDFNIRPTPQTKLYVAPKIDPNANIKGFRPSLQDPFINKNLQSDFNKVTTYNPTIQSTTLANNYYDYNFAQHQLQHQQDQQNYNFNYEQKKHKIHDSLAAGDLTPIKTASDIVPSSYRPTYEVIETTEADYVTQATPAPWSLTSHSYEYNYQKATEESVRQGEFLETSGNPGITLAPELPEEFAIVTEAEKSHDNSLSYDSEVESQSRRPLGDDFEPIGKHKLKDYYYKVSTPNYDNYSTSRRTKKPTEAPKYSSTQETTTSFNRYKENSLEQVEALPTLPPNQHFRRPASPITNEKDKIRKRNKIRRRRPLPANVNRNKEETTVRVTSTTFSTTEAIPTTEAEEVYTLRPRVRPTKSQQALTTPTVTTDLTTSALPTVSPTIPTIVKKKLLHRRPITTMPAKVETTTQQTTQEDLHNDSPIMKISNRPYLQRFNDNKNDYTHKQDEKDTPTSDVALNLSDTLKTTISSAPDFSFHKDFKPIEAKLESVTKLSKETTTEVYREESTEYTTTPRLETPTTERSQRPRLRNKFNRTRFNVKDYRSRLNSTTSTTEKSTENTPKIRLPQRRVPYSDIENETTTERKKFTPKEPRHKPNSATENKEQLEKNIHSFKPSRQRQTTPENIEAATVKVSARIRNGQRRPRPPPAEDFAETTSSSTTYNNRRPLRNKVKDSEISESVQDISVTETTVYEKNDITSERSRSESAIMKIADKKHQDHLEHLFEHSKRVSDLTLAASKDYNKPGMFKTVSSNSRRIPNYFTIATEDPILPIEAFFPQLNQKKDA